MQITLNQDEIEDAVRNHVLSQLAIRDDQEISLDFRAGRGDNGITATLDVRNCQGQQLVQRDALKEARQALVGRAQREADQESADQEKTPPDATGPTKKAAAKKAQSAAPKKGRKPKTDADIGPNEMAESLETPEQAKATEAKKNIFTRNGKGNPERPPETEDNDSQTTPDVPAAEAEDDIPDQETPAEEETRAVLAESQAATEKASAANPFAGDDDGEDGGQTAEASTDEAPADEAPADKPKSIFAFAQKPA